MNPLNCHWCLDAYVTTSPLPPATDTARHKNRALTNRTNWARKPRRVCFSCISVRTHLRDAPLLDDVCDSLESVSWCGEINAIKQFSREQHLEELWVCLGFYVSCVNKKTSQILKKASKLQCVDCRMRKSSCNSEKRKSDKEKTSDMKYCSQNKTFDVVFQCCNTSKS